MRRIRITEDYLGYYVLVGRTPTKKVKNLTFRLGVPGAVWDRKIHALMMRLPYFRKATAEEIAAMESGGKAPAGRKAATPRPDQKDQNAERDALRAELDRRGIAYHHRHGPAKLFELLQAAPVQTPETETAEA